MAVISLSSNPAFGYEALTVADTAVGVTFAQASDAERMIATVETAQVRYRYDGGSPTAADGHLAEVGDVIVIEGSGNITAFRAIRTGGTSGVLRITFER